MTYSARLRPIEIVTGSDGNLWFVGEPNVIGKVTTSGSFTYYTIQPLTSGGSLVLWGITVGPDGNIWFGGGNFIGRITAQGTITEFALPAGSSAQGQLVTGPERDIWFADTAGSIDKMTLTGAVTRYPVPPVSFMGNVAVPYCVVRGLDLRIWYCQTGTAGGIAGVLDPDGSAIQYPPVGGVQSFRPWGMAFGRDRNLWITNQPDSITRMTFRGESTNYVTPTFESFPWEIVSGPDGNLWFTENFANQIGRLTTAGAFTEFTIPSGTGPFGITVGPDGALWFAISSGAIGRIHP